MHGFVNPAVHRGSTVLFPNVAARKEGAKHRFEQFMTYGTQGGPTHYAFEDVIAEIEGGTRCLVVGTGLAAVAVPLLAYLKAGDHCLMPDNVYGPARNLCEGLLKGWGIDTTYYDPTVDEAGMAALIQPEHQGRLYREPRQPHLRGAGHPRHRPRRPCPRRQGADGQYLGHPPLPCPSSTASTSRSRR